MPCLHRIHKSYAGICAGCGGVVFTPMEPRYKDDLIVNDQFLDMKGHNTMEVARTLAPYNRTFVLTRTGVKIAPEVLDLVLPDA